MVETSEDSDAMPAKMEKISKKNKTRTDDLQYVGDKLVEINGDLLMEKGNKLREKKRKSETIEDGDEDQDDKGNLLNDGDLPKKDKKKRKRDFPEKAQLKENEQGQDNEPAVERDCDPKVVKKKTTDGNGTGISSDNCQEDMFEKMGKKKKKKKKSDTRNPDTEMIGIVTEESTLKTQGTEDQHDKCNSANEDEGEDQYDKDNLVNDGDLQKKDKKKKKRKRDASEQAQIKENRQGQDDEATVEKDCDPKLQEKATSDGDGAEISKEDCQEVIFEKADKKKQKKKKKTDIRNPDTEMIGTVTEESTLKTQSTEDQHDKSNSANEVEGEGQYDKDNLVNDGDLQKKDKKKKRKRDSSEQAQIKGNRQGQDDEATVEKDCDPKPQEKATSDGDRAEISKEDCQEVILEKADKKKQKKKKITDGQSSGTRMNGIVTEESTLKTQGTEVSKGIKKNNSVEHNSEKQKVKAKGIIVNKKATKSVKNNKEEPKAKGKSKKVSFSGHVEVFPSSDTRIEKDGLVQGKRFTPEEDEIIKEAVLNFIAVNNLGENGLEMVLNCKKYPGLKKCWQDIATCIPYRTVRAVYYRGHILFERAETCGWTPEEIEHLKELHKKYGKDWKKLGQELGKHRFHVKDAWRRIKFENKKTGRWSQEEYQNLYDLVNLDLQIKINGEKKSKHGMLRDNIPWTAISEKLSTRTDSNCCIKWYDQLTSSLVAEKKWSDTDDYWMIGALYELDAACVEDVDWDNLLEHRPGDICKKRWDQMVKHIGHQGSQPFAEQVDTLAKRYCPDLADTREAWDNKPLVP